MISFYDAKIRDLKCSIKGAILFAPTTPKDVVRTTLLASDDYKGLSEQEFDACWDEVSRALA